MAVKKKAEALAENEKKKSGLGPLIHKVSSVLAVLSATFLFAATFDVGHMGLAPALGSLTAIPRNLRNFLNRGDFYNAKGR